MIDAQSDADSFIYLVSHDLRSSVRALSELPAWIEEDLVESGTPLPAGVQTSIDLMHRHTARLERMLTDLLIYARIGRQQDCKRVSFERLLANSINSVPGASHIALECELSCREAPLAENDVQVLFTALIDNALKHGGAELRTLHVSTSMSDGELSIAVADDGIGIAPENHSRAIAPMTTLQSRDDVEGSGMGLAIVAKVAKTHGGDVCLSSSPLGSGLCVTATLRCER